MITLCLILSVIYGSALTVVIMKKVFNSEVVLRMGFVLPMMAGLGFILFTIVALRVRKLVKNKNLF